MTEPPPPSDLLFLGMFGQTIPRHIIDGFTIGGAQTTDDDGVQLMVTVNLLNSRQPSLLPIAFDLTLARSLVTQVTAMITALETGRPGPDHLDLRNDPGGDDPDRPS